MKKYILFLPVLLVLSLPAWAATYYVDFDAGADTNNGTATGTAFKHCPGDDAATDTADSTTIAAGDTVIFKGGVVYKGRIDMDWSGSAGSVITYDGNTAGTWGTGKAIIDGENTNTDARRYGFYAAASRSYITIDNFEIREMGGGASFTNCASPPAAINGYGIYLESPSNVTIQNCYIHQIGDWENGSTNVYMHINGMEGTGIHVRASSGDATNVVIDNTEFTKMGRAGISLDARSNRTLNNIEIKNYNIYEYVRWGIQVVANGNGTTIQNISVHDGTIRDVWQYAPNDSTYGWRACAGQHPHYDGMIWMIGGSPYTGQTLGTTANPNRIYNNLFYNDSPATDEGTATIFLTVWGGTLYIYNNVAINPLSPYGMVYAQDGAGTVYSNPSVDYIVANNSLYLDLARAFSFRTLNANYALNEGTIKIYNNAIYKEVNNSYYPFDFNISNSDQYSMPTEVKNNRIYTGRSDSKIARVYEGGALAYKTVAELNAMDNTNYTGNVAGDPLFTSILGGLDNTSSSNDLTLQAASLGIDNGVDLSAYFTTDILGNTRSGTWDIGAYEYGGVDATPSAYSYTNVTGASNSTLTTTSPCVTVAGIDAGQTPAITISGAGCTFNVDGGAYGSDASTVGLDNVVCLQGTSSASYSTTYPSCTLTIGGVTDSGAPWTVRTGAGSADVIGRGVTLGPGVSVR